MSPNNSTIRRPNVYGRPTLRRPNVYGRPTLRRPNVYGRPTLRRPNVYGRPTLRRPNVYGRPTLRRPTVYGRPDTPPTECLRPRATSIPPTECLRATHIPPNVHSSYNRFMPDADRSRSLYIKVKPFPINYKVVISGFFHYYIVYCTVVACVGIVISISRGSSIDLDRRRGHLCSIRKSLFFLANRFEKGLWKVISNRSFVTTSTTSSYLSSTT